MAENLFIFGTIYISLGFVLVGYGANVILNDPYTKIRDPDPETIALVITFAVGVVILWPLVLLTHLIGKR